MPRIYAYIIIKDIANLNTVPTVVKVTMCNRTMVYYTPTAVLYNMYTYTRYNAALSKQFFNIYYFSYSGDACVYKVDIEILAVLYIPFCRFCFNG